MKNSQSKPRNISGKKITYSSIVNEKSPKNSRPAREFQLIYKIKNRENENLEESFESMILLKSKNKINKYSDTHNKNKQKSNIETGNMKEVFDKINRKIQEHTKKASPRLINLLSMNSFSPRSQNVNQSRINTNRIKKKSKNKVENHITNRINTLKQQKATKKPKKLYQSQIQQSVKQFDQQDQQTQYILFQNQIHPIACQTHKNLTSLMKSTYDKSDIFLNLDDLENDDIQQQQINQQDLNYILSKYATQIQKVWRGYSTRKQLFKIKPESKHQNSLCIQNNVNGMLIELFQQIVDLESEQTKVQLLKSFRQVLNNRYSTSSHNEKDVAENREQAVHQQFQAQTNVLKCLLITKTITHQQYKSKVDMLHSWGESKKQEINRIHLFVQQTKIRTRQIMQETDQITQTLQSVQLLNSSPEVLLKIFSKIQRQRVDNSFCEEKSRQSKVSQNCTSQSQSIDVKTLVFELQNKQKIKNQIQFRMLQQLGYFGKEVSPVNTTNIGIHQFLSDILSYVEEYYKQQFLRWINMPYGYSSESRLKLLQGYDVKSEEDEYGMVEGIQNVLSEDILLKYQKSVHNNRDQHTIYHQKAVFDAFNQCLNVYRPYYSIKGPPYLWNNSQKALTFYYIAQQNIEQVFQKTKQQVLKQASSLCGILCNQPDSPQSLKDLLMLRYNCNEMISQCRDEKMNRMQIQTILSTDIQWNLIQQEKTQTMLNISELMLSMIINQMVDDIQQVSR